VTKAFVEHIKKLKPDIEIVDQQWPKLGEADYTPFINAQMGKRPEAVFSSLWGGHFVTFAKQAKPLKYFEALNSNFIAAGEGASIESTRSMGADYPVGIWGNAYDAFNWESAPPAHKDYIARLKAYTKEEHPSSWPITGYIAMQVLTEAIKKANSTDSDTVAKALLDLTVDTPIGKQTIRAKDHNANRGQVWGKTAMNPKYPFAVMQDIMYIDPAPFMD
jgi:branched-chain amino acid transport system substrate-binding protein